MHQPIRPLRADAAGDVAVARLAAPRPRPSACGGVAIVLSALWAAAERAVERRRQRRALMGLNDYMLKDIGLSRTDAFQEYDKPAWRP